MGTNSITAGAGSSYHGITAAAVSLLQFCVLLTANFFTMWFVKCIGITINECALLPLENEKQKQLRSETEHVTIILGY